MNNYYNGVADGMFKSLGWDRICQDSGVSYPRIGLKKIERQSDKGRENEITDLFGRL